MGRRRPPRSRSRLGLLGREPAYRRACFCTPRRGLMIGADVVRFGAFAALAFTTSAVQIVVLAAVVGVATGLFRPALYAGVPNLVEDGDLPAANSLLQTVDNLTWAIGSVAGGGPGAGAGLHAA